MTDEFKVRCALEARLLAMVGVLPSAMQNTDFMPVDGQPYQRVAVLFATPESGDMGRKITKLQGIFQVVLMYPTGVGTADAEAMAGAIKEWFKPPTTLVEDDVKVIIADAIAVATGFPLDGRFAVPISIPWQSWVS